MLRFAWGCRTRGHIFRSYQALWYWKLGFGGFRWYWVLVCLGEIGKVGMWELYLIQGSQMWCVHPLHDLPHLYWDTARGFVVRVLDSCFLCKKEWGESRGEICWHRHCMCGRLVVWQGHCIWRHCCWGREEQCSWYWGGNIRHCQFCWYLRWGEWFLHCQHLIYDHHLSLTPQY